MRYGPEKRLIDIGESKMGGTLCFPKDGHVSVGFLFLGGARTDTADQIILERVSGNGEELCDRVRDYTHRYLMRPGRR